ncbi:DUF6783 domain-containing protein [Robinsoniella peoriensis]
MIIYSVNWNAQLSESNFQTRFRASLTLGLCCIMNQLLLDTLRRIRGMAVWINFT